MPVQFSDVITTEDQLRQLIGHPGQRVVRKSLTALDKHCRSFIGRSPFVLIASSDAQGNVDISPKGDPPGFVQVLADDTLAIPDRPGNRRADTFSNILQNPKIGLFFLIPGKRETLRVSGTAQLVRDEALRESMAMKGKAPQIAVVVHVEEAFFHCAKCIIRSDLWQAENWPALEGLPTLAETMIDAGRLDETVEEMQEMIDLDYVEELY